MIDFQLPKWFEEKDKYHCIGGVGSWCLFARTTRRNTKNSWDVYLFHQDTDFWHRTDLAKTKSRDVHTISAQVSAMIETDKLLTSEDPEQGMLRFVLLIKIFAPHLMRGNLFPNIRETLKEIERMEK